MTQPIRCRLIHGHCEPHHGQTTSRTPATVNTLSEHVPVTEPTRGNQYACLRNLPIAQRKSTILSAQDLEKDSYALATIHRAENVDNPKTLSNFIEIFERSPLPVILPLHPRTVNPDEC